MRDCKKFCRPKTIKIPKTGDIIITSPNGKQVYVDYDEFQRIKQFFPNYSVYGGKDKFTANPGDILLENGQILSKEDFLNQTKEAVGIVFLNAKQAPDGKARVVSLDYMNYLSPQLGSKNYNDSGTNIPWGYSDHEGLQEYQVVPRVSIVDNQPTGEIGEFNTQGFLPTDMFGVTQSATPGYGYEPTVSVNFCPPMYSSEGTLNSVALTNPENFKNALADFSGKENTKTIMKKCTVELPGDDSEEGNYPAAQTCSLYSKGNLKWYLPSLGELACIMSNMYKIGESRVDAGYPSYQFLSGDFWTSTRRGGTSDWYVSGQKASVAEGISQGTAKKVLAVASI